MADAQKDDLPRISDGDGTMTPGSRGATTPNLKHGAAASSIDSTMATDDDRHLPSSPRTPSYGPADPGSFSGAPGSRAGSAPAPGLAPHRTLSRVQSFAQELGRRPACFGSTAQEVSFVAQATIAMAATTFLVGASSIVTASIGADLDMTQAEVVWIAAAPTLTAGAFQLAVGQLSDLLGRRLVYLAGMGSFAVFILLLGFARNPFWMDVVLGVLGISCAMVVPPAGGILGQAYGAPSKRKNMAFAAFSAGNPTGFVFGSITCGIATMLFNWRASFWFISMLWAVFFLHALWAVPSVEAYQPGEPLKQRLATFVKTFDWLGGILTLAGTGMLAAGITLGPTDGWKSPVTLCLLIIGVVLIIVFIFWETKYPFPMMPPFIWKDRNFNLIMAVTVAGFMSFQAASFYLAYYLQQVRQWGALDIAVHLLPQVIAGLAWNVLIGYILHKVNNTLIMAAGSISYLAASLLLSFMQADSNYWAFIFPALILNVVGADFQFNVANMYVMQSLPPKQQGLASGIMNTLVRLASTLSMGIATAVYSSVELSAQGQAQPMLKFTRTFQVSVALAAVGLLCVPFLRVGTQGNHRPRADDDDDDDDDHDHGHDNEEAPGLAHPVEVAEKDPPVATGQGGKQGQTPGATVTRKTEEV